MMAAAAAMAAMAASAATMADPSRAAFDLATRVLSRGDARVASTLGSVLSFVHDPFLARKGDAYSVTTSSAAGHVRVNVRVRS